MKIKLFFFSLFIAFSTLTFAMTDDEIASIDAFLEDAPQRVLTSLSKQLYKHCLGFTSEDMRKATGFSKAEQDFIISKLDKLHTLPLTFVNLCEFGLKELPKNLFLIPGLRVVVLAHNEIRTLPKRIAGATDLEVLSMGNNKLSKLPEDIAELEKLILLDLARNKLKKLPVELLDHDLENRTIWIDNNKIKFEKADPKILDAIHATLEYEEGELNPKYDYVCTKKVDLKKAGYHQLRINSLDETDDNRKSATRHSSMPNIDNYEKVRIPNIRPKTCVYFKDSASSSDSSSTTS